MYLYKITNTKNSKVYIGITSDPKRRWGQHQKQNSACVKLSRAMVKHGIENFSMQVLCKGTPDYINDLEVKAILAYDAVENGYNIQSGGGIGFGYTCEYRVTDEPTFVSGFWFPNVRTALRSLNMPKATYGARRVAGTLGHIRVTTAPKKTKVPLPVYVRGFWYPTVHVASSVLGIGIKTVHQNYRKERKKCQRLS